jgi:micrococcal nuclease
MRTRILKTGHVLFGALLFIVAVALPSGTAREWVIADEAVDGDTFRLTDGSWVRCLGIDAPEIDHDARTAQPMGYDARSALARLVNRRKVVLDPADAIHDAYGRRLALVSTEKGEEVNQVMIEKGLAHVLAYAPYTDHDARLLTVQRQAMRLGIGIWQQAKLKKSGNFIGNQRSRRFHRADCSQARKIHQKNKIALSTQWDGYWRGYAPCRQCFPVK